MYIIIDRNVFPSFGKFIFLKKTNYELRRYDFSFENTSVLKKMIHLLRIYDLTYGNMTFPKKTK